MHKRPICIACICLMVLILIFRAAGVPVFGEPSIPDSLRKKLARGTRVTLCGTVDERQMKNSSVQYIIHHASVSWYGSTYSFEKVKTTLTGETSVYMRKGDDLLLTGTSLRYTEIPVGSRVTLSGSLSEIEAPGNPGQFDSRSYFACQRIFYEMFCERAVVEEEMSGLKEDLTSIRCRIREGLSGVMHEDSAGVLSAMLLGDRSLLSEESRLNYQSGGVMHVLAVSGLHLSLLGMAAFELLLRLLMLIAGTRHERVLQAAAALFSSSLMAVFCLFTGSSVSSVRAWIMFAVTLTARVMHKSYDPLCSLGFSGILLLLTCPGYLFYTGFQLSFAAVLGAAGVYPSLIRLLPVSFWRGGNRKKSIFHSAAELSLCWCAVTLTTLPLTAYYFYRIPVLGIIANILIVPVMSLVMEIGVIGSAALLISRRLAWLLLIPDDLLLQFFQFLTGAVRSLPFSVWTCGKPALWQLIAWYVLLSLLLILLHMGQDHTPDMGQGHTPAMDPPCHMRPDHFPRPFFHLPLTHHRKILAALLLPVMFLLLFYRKPVSFSLTMLDVGQGDALLLRTGSHAFLIDGGSSDEKGVGSYRIVPYLESQGISHLDGVFLTHGDSDHYSGMEEMLLAEGEDVGVITIERMYMPYWLAEENTGVRLRQECQNAGIPVALLRQGDAITAGDLKIDVLHPLAEGGETEGNAGSLVLSVRYKNFSALLTGDLEGEGEKEILPFVRDVDYLKVGHHGSRYSTSENLLAAADPEICTISAPVDSMYGHPHKETLERIAACGAEAWCTRDCGAITVSVENDRIHLSTYRSRDL